MVTISEALRTARDRLRAAAIDDPDIEAEVLLRHALGIDRAGLFQRLPEELPEKPGSVFDSYVDRRLKHEPTAYITGHREFYGLDLLVSPATLIPRPETETLVDVALQLIAKHTSPVVIDVGTGSGAIAIAIAHVLPSARVLATDSSPEALAVAKRNANRLSLSDRITILHGDLLQPVEEPIDLVVANLPYVPERDWLSRTPEVYRYEPSSGFIGGGGDGLNLVRRLLIQMRGERRPRLGFCLEFGDGQTDAIQSLCRHHFPDAQIEVRGDQFGDPRVIVASFMSSNG